MFVWASGAVLVALAGPASGEGPAPGAVYYRQYCATCHGATGQGDGPAADALRVRPSDLTRIALRRQTEFPRTEIAEIIDGRSSILAHGSREMPIWGWVFAAGIGESGISEERSRARIRSLVLYLESIQLSR
jgi:hypothetical protein